MSEVTSFFRCFVCGKAMEMTEFLAKCQAKCKCGSGRFFETVLTPFEAAKYLITHPKVAYDTLKHRLLGDR